MGKLSYSCQIGYLFIAEGRFHKVKPADNRRFSMQEIQKAVGGYFEMIPFDHKKGYLAVYVNEDGVRLDLPRNAHSEQVVDMMLYGSMDPKLWMLRGNIFGVKHEEFDPNLPTINKILKGLIQ